MINADDRSVGGKNDAPMPKCVCGWKNCRTYQKAFREVKHQVFDGVIKLKFVRDDDESMALKDCIDRTLRVPKDREEEWKEGKRPGQEVLRYYVARHHFTEKHIKKYLNDPKTYSFFKPFSVHGAKKYLFTVDDNEVLKTSSRDGEKLYLQCPNVPKEVVKAEFMRIKEKTQQQNGQHLPKEAAPDPRSQQLIKQKEEENKQLKEQLESMKSQLTFLHDMVRRLQEEHFDHQSQSARSRSDRQRVPGVGGADSNHTDRSAGVPKEITMGDDDYNNNNAEDWTEQEDESDIQDQQDQEPEQDHDDDDESVKTFHVQYQAARRFSGGTVATTGVVSVSKSVRTLPREIELDEDEDDSESHESLEEEAFETRSFASSMRPDSSHSRPMSSRAGGGGGGFGGSNRDDARQNRQARQSRRSTISGAAGGFNNNNNNNNNNNSSSNNNANSNGNSGGPGHGMQSRRSSVGGGASGNKKPFRRQSMGPNGRRMSVGPGSSKSWREKGSGASTASGDNAGTSGTHHVSAMVVTDPYGEKGSYTGSISNATGMPHGYGRLEYDRAGRWYEGDWKHGRWTGRGRLSNGDGDFYEGGLKNDHKHGYGVMKFADGRIFEGEYISGQMVDGKMTYQDGSTYAGRWVDGMRHGTGKCVFTDGSVYEGEFREGEFYGHGRMEWSDGGWYEGEWWNGEMHGHGKEVRPDGSLRHEGDWAKGQPVRR